MGRGRSSDERTPLIQQEPVVEPTSYKKTYHIYGTTLGFLFIFSFLIHFYRTVLPTPLSDIQAKAVDDFSGIHAYNEYLSRFTAPHSVNSRENAVMRDFIGETALEFQKKAIEKGLEMDVIDHDISNDAFFLDWHTSNESWVISSRNVIVRLHGTSNRSEALLINAHYDSVPTSNGVTDNGMGVVTTMELLRYFVENPPLHNIIFLFNNFEEGGLIGAKSFVKHPWFSDVKLFLNLEGAGAGGRILNFRNSNLNAVQKLAGSSATYKHSSPLGNDMFKAQLIKSDTDYSIFTEVGVPGLDVAFYSPRSHYHTPRDDLVHTTPEALQYMGQFALGAVKAIINSDDIVDTPQEQQTFIYYDILGRVMVAYSFTVYQVINALALFAVPAVALFISLQSHQEASATDALKKKAVLFVHGLAAAFSALFIVLFVTLLSVYFMSKMNPSMTYGDIYGAALYTFVSAFLGLQVSQLILPSKLKRSLAETDASWYGLITLWWLLVVLAVFTGSKQVAGLYFAVYLLAFTSLAALIHVYVPANKKFRSPLIFFTQTLVPVILLLEFAFLTMDAMRHNTADGTPEIAIYILLAIPLILMVLHFLPWVHVAGNNKRVALSSFIVFVFLFTVCSALQPFNSAWSPNKITFNQVYNHGETFATVTLATATGLQATLKQVLPAHEYDTMSCEPFKTYLTRCSYQTDLLPKYGSNVSLNEFVMSEVTKVCDKDVCKASIHYTSKNSLLCRISFTPQENIEPVKYAIANGQEIKSNNITSIVTYPRDYETPVEISIEYPASSPAPKATASCFYDEWSHSEIPAFSYLRDNLPESASLLIRGQGLVLVHYANLTF